MQTPAFQRGASVMAVWLQLGDCLRYERHVEDLGGIDLKLRFFVGFPRPVVVHAINYWCLDIEVCGHSTYWLFVGHLWGTHGSMVRWRNAVRLD